MHKLYRVTYRLHEGKESDDIASRFLFTEEEMHETVDWYSSFNSLLDAVKAHKCPGLYCGETAFTHRLFLYYYGVRFDGTITERDFVNPTSFETTYHECSPQHYDYDFFKKNLSMNDFMTFIQERYGTVPSKQGLGLKFVID